MRLLHCSDLHIGKRLLERNLLEDQIYILNQMIQIAVENKVDTVLLAGDIYDKSVPSAEAVEVFDQFLSRLSSNNINTFVISGNHDSAERIAFGASLLKSANVFVSPVYDGKISKITLNDEYGHINFYNIPFVKPVHIRNFSENEIKNYTDALNEVISRMNVNTAERNICLSHQFVTGAEKAGSEEVTVGGIEDVSAAVYKDFDYTALGHIHRAQNITDSVRYCGTPLKYSFSEVNDSKSVTLIDLKEKGTVDIETVSLTPLRDLKEIKGQFNELLSKEFLLEQNTNDYYHIILTDEEDIPNGANRLRVAYPNLLKLDYDNSRTRADNSLDTIENLEEKSEMELFSDFYYLQNGQNMSVEQTEIVKELFEKLKGDNA